MKRTIVVEAMLAALFPLNSQAGRGYRGIIR